MTEDQWLTCDDSMKMLRAVKDRVSRRKAALFAASSCRRLSAWLPPEYLDLVADIEDHADDPTRPDVDGEESELAFEAAQFAAPEPIRGAFDALMEALFEVWNNSEGIEPAEADEPAWRAERAAQADLVREIVGNPFRPVLLDRSRLGSDVVELARAIYEVRGFGRMHELADALERSGCPPEDGLSHRCSRP